MNSFLDEPLGIMYVKHRKTSPFKSKSIPFILSHIKQSSDVFNKLTYISILLYTYAVISPLPPLLYLFSFVRSSL